MIQYILAFSEAEIVGVYQNMKNNKDLRFRKRSLKVAVNSENHLKSRAVFKLLERHCNLKN